MLGAQGISPAATLSTALPTKVGAKVPGASEARLKEMAKEMEATFLSMLLKEMRQTLDPEEGGLFPGDTADVQGGLFDQYMSQHLADGGGVGLAAALIRQMQATAPKAPPTHYGPVPLNPSTGTHVPQAPRT